MKIVFTGGGTGGHTIPNIAIISEFKKLKPYAQIFYIGSHNSIEEKFARENKLKFFIITVGKLRRYFSWQNFLDAIKIPIGILQAILILRKIKPDAVFAKGGFVSLPTTVAAGILHIPLVIHESDSTFGLATRVSSKFAKKICVSFPLKTTDSRITVTGNPIRTTGSTEQGKRLLNFKNKKPIVLIVGGSSGANFLNNLTISALPSFIQKVNIVWICGKNKKPIQKIKSENIRLFEFLDIEYLDILAAADLVVSRAGANAIFEIAAAKKPSILIPLPKNGSRGDQILNANFFEESGASINLEQKDISVKKFTEIIFSLLKNTHRRKQMATATAKLAPRSAATKIAKIILSVIQK